MQQPVHDADTLFEQLLQDLPPEIETLAREFKAFTRARKVKTPQQGLRLVFLYCGLDQTLREVAGTFTLLEEDITDTSVAERLAACGPWLKAVLASMVGVTKGSLLPESMRLVIVDASVIAPPGAPKRCYRIHVCLDVVRGELLSIEITDTSTGESLKRFVFQAGDVVVADRGYAHRDAVIGTVSGGSHVIVRFDPQTMPVEHLRGGPFDILKDLKYQKAQTTRTFPVLMRSRSGAEMIRGWVHAYRLGPIELEKARRRCRRRCQRRGKTASQRMLVLAEWVLIFSSVAPGTLSAEAILEIYRTRWQVELLFKRWKSLLDVDQVRSKVHTSLGDVWLHGKLVYAMMIDAQARRQYGTEWTQFDGERSGTWWRVWKMIRTQVAPLITGVSFWSPDERAACLQALTERRRKRKLQHLPVSVHARFGLSSQEKSIPEAA